MALAESSDKPLFLDVRRNFVSPIILLGISIANLASHGFAGMLVSWITSFLGPETLRWIPGVFFLGMAIWTFFLEKFEEDDTNLACYSGREPTGPTSATQIEHQRTP